jgi:anthranilate phosphoribosyltransferase
MSHQFNKYIKAVGTGTKHNYDLSQDEMDDAMSMILKGEVYPEQISAFLLGWRLKPETIDEFKGALDAFDKLIIKNEIPNSVELGYPFDGKRNNPYLFTLIAKVLEKYNINIVISGDKLQPAKNGVTVKDIAQNIKLTSNLHFFNRANNFKELSGLTEIRNRLAIRTGLNTVERLTSPAKSDIGFVGVFHKPFMEKYASMFGSRYKKLIIIKGNEGTSEVYSKCQYWIVENGQITEHKIDPENFGINYTKSWDRITLDESINAIENPSDELMNIVKLNAALILFSLNKVDSIEDGYKLLL